MMMKDPVGAGFIPRRRKPLIARVSNDNPHSGSLFRTTKYGPQWASEGFRDLGTVRTWVNGFVD